MKRIGKDENSQKMNMYVMAGIVSLVIAVVGYLILIAIQNAMLSSYDRTLVAILVSDAPEGCPVDKADFTWTEIDSQAVPSDALSESDIVNRYLASSLTRGTVLTASNTALPPSFTEGMDGIEVGLSVKNLQASANGMVRTGDYINLYLVPASGKIALYDGQTDTFENTDDLPVSRHIFVNSARSDDGLELYQGDTISATRLNLILSPRDAEYVTYMMATKGCSAWVTICRD